MKFNVVGNFLSFERLKKKNGEPFFISKVLTDTDDVVKVFSNEEPSYSRSEEVLISVDVNLSTQQIYSKFSD